jgi:hypothetical protein
MNLAEDELEPLVLADGRKIDPTSGKVIKDTTKPSFVEVPSGIEAQQLVVKARKTVAELPLPPSQLNAVGLVAFYTLFGLPDVEIALATENKLTVEQIKNIRDTDAYKEFMVAAKTNIIETANDSVRELFQSHAAGAARKIINIANEDDGALGFKASQDVLDRAGHRPADVVEHRHRMEDALQIVFIKKDETQQVPVIDVTPERIDYDASSE